MKSSVDGTIPCSEPIYLTYARFGPVFFEKTTFVSTCFLPPRWMSSLNGPSGTAFDVSGVVFSKSHIFALVF